MFRWKYSTTYLVCVCVLLSRVSVIVETLLTQSCSASHRSYQDIHFSHAIVHHSSLAKHVFLQKPEVRTPGTLDSVNVRDSEQEKHVSAEIVPGYTPEFGTVANCEEKTCFMKYSE